MANISDIATARHLAINVHNDQQGSPPIRVIATHWCLLGYVE